MLEVAEFRIFGERHEMVTQIPGTIAEALAEAAKLPAEDYTKQSYYLFQKELEYVKSAVGNSDYTEQELINEIYDARNLLVPYTTFAVFVRRKRKEYVRVFFVHRWSRVWNRSLRSRKGRASDQLERHG